MGKPIVKLMRGSRVLDLNDQVRYWLSQDFTPPATAITPSFTGMDGDVFNTAESNRPFSFTVGITGSSEAQVARAVRAIVALLRDDGHTLDTLYLAYGASDSVPEPVWGQAGALIRYEVAFGEVALSDGYMVGVRRSSDINVSVNLILKPYALGKEQRLCSATGGIIEDRSGVTDGRARGLFIPEAATNKMTNPIFGHATWDNGWTTEANLIGSECTDARFVLFGLTSARLIGLASVPTSGAFYQSINVGNTNAHLLSFYAKKPDATAVTASDIRPRYNATVYAAATYTAVGDGWYRVTQAVTGVNSAVAVGVVIQTAGVTIYVDGVQIEERAYATPVVYGDLLGCAWSGTAHASTSTRTAAVMSLPIGPTILPDSPFSIRVVFTSLPVLGTAEGEILDARDGTHLSALRFYMSAGVTPSVTYGGPTLTGTALAANTTYTYHITFDGATIRLYVNGVSVSSGSASPAASGPTLFIGCNYSSAVQLKGSLRGLATFDMALTAAQVAADADNLSAAISDGYIVESIPWLWTKDGDSVVDNCNDSTRDNWCVVGGVPGTTEAQTLLDVTASGLDSWIMLGLTSIAQWCDPGSYLYADLSGTADANSSGGEYKSWTVDTSGLTPFTLLTIQDNPIRYAAFSGKEFMPLMRVYDVGASQVNYRFKPYGSSGYAFDNSQTLPASWQMAKLQPFQSISQEDVFADITAENVSVMLVPVRVTGSADVRIDYVLLMPKPIILIAPPFSAAAPSILLQGVKAVEYLPASSNRFMIPKPSVTGEAIEFRPEMYNTLLINLGTTITRTLTFNSIQVTPRWDLL